jgi:hypothetical protein
MIQTELFAPNQIMTTNPNPPINTNIYNFIEDPGHGWLQVPITELTFLGIIDKITPYSPKVGSFMYLEEDCDAGLFLSEMKKRGYDTKITATYVEDFDEYLASV